MISFEWNQIKPIGDELSKINDEAHLRSAFGRYYYAPYCSTRFYLIDLGNLEYWEKGSHMNLFKDLQTSSNDNKKKQLGYKLENLFKKRVDADYLLERNGNPLNLDYFKNELKNVQLQSSEALALVSILKYNPPSHRIRI